MIIPFRIMFLRLKCIKKDVFFGINFCDVGILWKKCEIYFCNPNVLTKFFPAKSKKEDAIYMGIIYMLSYREIYFVKKFTFCRRLCGVINFSVY